MSECKAFGCTNNKRRNKDEKFFCVPKPVNEERKAIAQKWLHNIGTGHTVDKFPFGRNSVVCEDHFEPDCYERNLQAELLGYTGRTRLKPDAVPTIFVHRPEKKNTGRKSRLEKRKQKRVSRFDAYFIWGFLGTQAGKPVHWMFE